MYLSPYQSVTLVRAEIVSYSSVLMDRDHCLPGPLPDTSYTMVSQTDSAPWALLSDRQETHKLTDTQHMITKGLCKE